MLCITARLLLTLGDCWSLISLRNDDGRNLELKFVQSLHRQFESTVDAFQIILDDNFLREGACSLSMPTGLAAYGMSL